MKKILHEEFASKISPMTRFYVLWRWINKELKASFDEAKKLAQSVGIDLEREWNKGFIKKEKQYIKILGPKDRKTKELDNSHELIDILHRVLLFWELGNRDEMLKILLSSGYGNDETFYLVAQAISATLSNNSKEKKLLDGVLAGKEKIKEQIEEENAQIRLDNWM